MNGYIFLIPTQFGGGAEKIFALLKSHVEQVGTSALFLTIWKSNSHYLLSNEMPSSLFKRLKGAAAAALRLMSFFTETRHVVVVFLPLALITGSLAKLLTRRSIYLIYCRRNNYPSLTLNWVIEKFFIRYSDRIIFCSKEVITPVKPSQTIAVVENPIPKVKPICADAEGGIRICVVGRLTRQKRPFLALASFCHFNKEIADRSFELDILGDGELKSELIAKSRLAGVENLVHYLGHVPQPFSNLHYRILLHTSEFEGSPNTIYEAIANGLIVVCKKRLEGLSHLDERIRARFFIMVDESHQSDSASLWAAALAQACTLTSVHSRRDLMMEAREFAESDSEFATRFLKSLRYAD